MAKKFRATLWVRKIHDKGLEGYWTWELIIFSNPLSTCAFAVANLVPHSRYGSFKEAVVEAEKLAKLFNIEIDQRAYPTIKK